MWTLKNAMPPFGHDRWLQPYLSNLTPQMVGAQGCQQSRGATDAKLLGHLAMSYDATLWTIVGGTTGKVNPSYSNTVPSA